MDKLFMAVGGGETMEMNAECLICGISPLALRVDEIGRQDRTCDRCKEQQNNIAATQSLISQRGLNSAASQDFLSHKYGL